ncbi:repressed By RIM101 protein 1 [Sesamum indicum]|uniref:Repressed By RIM101 protein 1 n=1 Tax=Sesamum indicum TaxID=4182 RepID=A0A6I9U1X4_SESIN|nr:repressed By RIM101 protein 1 [Sesamum indicum]
MESRSRPHNEAEQAMSQGQMRRDEEMNQQSDMQNQGHATNFLQETGTQAKNIAQGAVNIVWGAAVGAANMAQGAAQGAATMAQGAAQGATTMAQGATDTVKNTLGMNSSDTTTSSTGGSTVDYSDGNTNTGGSTVNHPDRTADMGGSAYPNATNYTSNPHNTRT